MAQGRRVPAREDSGPRTRRVVVLLALAVVCALVLAPPQRLYVAAQARERLNVVMPGQVGYRVPDPEPSQDAAPGAAVPEQGTTSLDAVEVAALTRPGALPQGTWYDRLWSSVEAVGTGSVDPVLDVPAVGVPAVGVPAVGGPAAGEPGDG